MELPEVTDNFISDSMRDYEEAFQKGTSDALNSAKLRLVWALSHSKERKHNTRAVQLADEILKVPLAVPEDCTHREVEYMKAVAFYNMGSYVKCRQQCNAILAEQPESRQVISLKDAAEDALIKEGMIGVGVGLTGILGIGVALAIAAARR